MTVQAVLVAGAVVLVLVGGTMLAARAENDDQPDDSKQTPELTDR